MADYYGNQSRRRAPSRSEQDPGDAIREQRTIARRTQEGDQQARLVAALLQQRAQAIAGGAMEGELPIVSGNMSAADLVAAQGRINRVMQGRGIPVVSANNPSASAAAMLPKQDAGAPRVANGQVLTPNLQPKAAPAAAPAPAAVPVAPPAGAGRNAGEMMGPTQPGAQPQKMPTPAAPMEAPAPSNPALDAMVQDGTLPKGAALDRTGAGFSTQVQSQSGPRSVAVQPTMNQALAADYGDKAQEVYGEQWGGLNPDQKRAMLQSGPAHEEMAAGHKDLAEMDPRAFKGFRNTYGEGFATKAPEAARGVARATGETMGPTNVRAGGEVLGPTKTGMASISTEPMRTGDTAPPPTIAAAAMPMRTGDATPTPPSLPTVSGLDKLPPGTGANTPMQAAAPKPAAALDKHGMATAMPVPKPPKKPKEEEEMMMAKL